MSDGGVLENISSPHGDTSNRTTWNEESSTLQRAVAESADDASSKSRDRSVTNLHDSENGCCGGE